MGDKTSAQSKHGIGVGKGLPGMAGVGKVECVSPADADVQFGAEPGPRQAQIQDSVGKKVDAAEGVGVKAFPGSLLCIARTGVFTIGSRDPGSKPVREVIAQREAGQRRNQFGGLAVVPVGEIILVYGNERPALKGNTERVPPFFCL